MKNNSELIEIINNSIDERLNISYIKLADNTYYKNLLKKHIAVFDTIRKKLKNDNITEEYQKLEFDIYSLQLREAYKIGFSDGISIYKNFDFKEYEK